MICFLGTSHAAVHLRKAALNRGCTLTQDPSLADVIFISEDTPTDASGVRNLAPIVALVKLAVQHEAQLVLTSQVPPGFTRSLGLRDILHQAETLRIRDAHHRAMHPDYIIVGGEAELHPEYIAYLNAFNTTIIRGTWEDAEFSKIAVNMFLAAQVEATNVLSKAARNCGADWAVITKALQADKRIGPEAYLLPGRWEDSMHLLRDSVTIERILTEADIA